MTQGREGFTPNFYCAFSGEKRTLDKGTSKKSNGKATFTVWNVSKYGVFSSLCFLAFKLNKERYELSLRIQSKCEKIRTRKNSVFGHISRSVFLSFRKFGKFTVSLPVYKSNWCFNLEIWNKVNRRWSIFKIYKRHWIKKYQFNEAFRCNICIVRLKSHRLKSHRF